VADYLSGKVKRHENTLPEKEADRIAHFKACRAQTEPVFFVMRPSRELGALFEETKAGECNCDFVDNFGVRNRCWIIDSKEGIARASSALESADEFYIADGHHRTASASAASPYIMAVIVPTDDVLILGYHRLCASIGSYSPEGFVERLKESFDIAEAGSFGAAGRHAIGLYIAGKAYTLAPKPGSYDEADPLASLDCAIVQENCFRSVLGITDPTTDGRLRFVGGGRGTDYLKTQVDEGNAAFAIALYPVGIEEVMAVADAGRIMPPKSTWFEPKLRSGLFIYPYEDF